MNILPDPDALMAAEADAIFDGEIDADDWDKAFSHLKNNTNEILADAAVATKERGE